MKITFESKSNTKAQLKVWVNDELHTAAANETLELPVQHGDTVQFQVGRLSARKKIEFVRPAASFAVVENQRFESIYTIAMVLVLVGLYFLKLLNAAWLYVLVIIALAGFFAIAYRIGYKAEPRHE